MNVERIRELLLERAIQGKLVPQLDSEPAVEQIGKAPEEVPFEIPRKWKWCLLEGVTKAISDGSHNPPPNTGSGIPVLSAKNVISGEIDFDSVNRWVNEDQWKIEDNKVHIEKRDVLLTIVGTIGRTALVETSQKFMLQRSVCVLKPEHLVVDASYLALLLSSPTSLQWLEDRSAGTAQKGVYLKTVKKFPVPLPPLAEQRRIVNRLNELLPLVDSYEKNEADLERLSQLLKSAVLQKAIEGKLVPQLDSEPAVEQIGKAPDEVPFEIPEKWKWCKLGECVQFNPKVSAKDETTVSFLKMACVDAGYSGLHTDGEAKVWKAVKQGFSRFNDGDVLLAKITPCFQNLKSSIAKNLASGVGAGSTEFHVLRGKDEVLPEYLLWFVKSPYLIKYGVDNFKGTAGQQRIGTKDLQECAFPLPSVSEQHRIVAQIKELFEQIDNYTKSTEVR